MQKPVSQVESVLNPAGFDKPQQLHAARALRWAHKKHRLQDVQNCSNGNAFHMYAAEHCVCLLLIEESQLLILNIVKRKARPY